MESGERGKRQSSGLSAEGRSDLSELTERESKARSKRFERPLRLRANRRRLPVAGVSSAVMSIEREWSPQWGATTIEIAEQRRRDSIKKPPVSQAVYLWNPGKELNVSPVDCRRSRSEASFSTETRNGSAPRAKHRRPPVAEVSSVLRSAERESSPQCGATTIEAAEYSAKIEVAGSEGSGAPVGHLTKSKATRTSQSKQAAG